MKNLFLTLIFFIGIYNVNAQNLQWVKHFGTSGTDVGHSICTDTYGNIYVTGNFDSGSITLGSITLTSAGATDIFIVKYNNDGVVQWAIQEGGSGCESGLTIYADNAGYLYVSGQYEETATFGEGDTSITSRGSTDIFVAKYTSDGDFLWVRSAGAGSPYSVDRGCCIVTDDIGNIYLAGGFYSETSTDTCFFDINTYIIGNGNSDIFIAKYSSDGEVLWVKKAGGVDYDEALSIGIDSVTNIYITGTFKCTAFFGDTSLIATGNTNEDLFLAKYDSDGNFIWAQKAGGSDIDAGNGLFVDKNCDIYLTGYFGGTATFGDSIVSSMGSYDMFFAKYNSSGTMQWLKHYGSSGTGTNSSRAIVLDIFGNIYITGLISGSVNFGTSTLTSVGWQDMFVAKFDSSANFEWAKSGGGAMFDRGNSLCADNSGNVFVTGWYDGTASFDDSTFMSSGGGWDCFIVKYLQLGTSIKDYSSYENTFSVYPNPANDIIYIHSNTPVSQNVTINIMDSKGQMIFSKKQTLSDGNDFQIYISKYPKGMYIINITSVTGIYAKKIFIQ